MQNLNQLHLRPECPHHAPSAGTQSWRGQVGMSAPKYWSKIVWLDVLLYKASTERLSECVCVSEGFIIVKNGVLYRAVKYELWNYKKTKKKRSHAYSWPGAFSFYFSHHLSLLHVSPNRPYSQLTLLYAVSWNLRLTPFRSFLFHRLHTLSDRSASGQVVAVKFCS